MAVITGGRSGKTEISAGTSDLSGAVSGDIQLGINAQTGAAFYRDASNQWRRYEEGVVVRATGVGATDTTNLTNASAVSGKVMIDDRDAPLVLDQGGEVAIGNTFLTSRSGMSRINLSNNTRLRFGTNINVASHGSWDACTVSADNDTVTSATLAGAEAGDILIVVAEDVIGTVAPHFGGGSTRPSEMALINRVVGTNIYLSTRLVDTYTSTPRCALLKVNGGGGLASLSVRAGMANIDFTGSNNSSWGSNSPGIVFYTAFRPIIENVIMRDTGAMILQSTLGAQVRGLYIDSQTNGFSDYGIALTNSDDTVIDGFICHRARHAFTTSAQASGTTRYGTLRRPIVRNAEAWSSGVDTAEYSSTFTASVANNNLVLATPGGLSLGAYVRFTTTGTLPSPLAAATTYYVRNISGNTIQVSATAGGAPVTITSAGTPTNTITRSYSSSSLATNESNLIFDTHPEGYEVTFEHCTAHLVGPSSLGGSGAGAIGFSSRSRGTIFRRCNVYGDTTQKHRGFKITSAPNTRIENCNMKGGWVGIHCETTGSTIPRPDAMTIIGGRYENLTNEGILLDSGIGHTVDGVQIYSVGASASGMFGSQRACISFHDRFGAGWGSTLVRNCVLPKMTNLYSIGIGGYGGTGPVLTASDIILENNLCRDYDHDSIGLQRTLSEAFSIEVKYAERQATKHPKFFVQQTAHGLVIGDKYAPIVDDHSIYDDTSANQVVVGILMDVVDADGYVLAGPGERIRMPDTEVEAGSGYTLASGRDLYYDQSTGLWKPTLPAGAHGDARPMLRVDAYLDNVLYCRVGSPGEAVL